MGPKQVRIAAWAHSEMHHLGTSDAIPAPRARIQAPKWLWVGAEGTRDGSGTPTMTFWKEKLEEI